MEGKYVIREGERYYWRGAMYGDDAKKATKFTFEAAKKRVERCGLEWEIVNAETLKVKLAWNFEKWTANSHIVKKPKEYVICFPELDSYQAGNMIRRVKKDAGRFLLGCAVHHVETLESRTNKIRSKRVEKSPVFDVPLWVAALPWLDLEYKITVNVKHK